MSVRKILIILFFKIIVMISDVPGMLDFETVDDKVKFHIGAISTNWMKIDDMFIRRIDESNLNPLFLKEHLIKEIEIKNILDEGIYLSNSGKCAKAIDCFDDVLFYDPHYGEALINKSFCFKAQRHFVKSLRHYRKAIREDECLRDNGYYKELLKLANDERGNFPKIKSDIYAGDEYFSKGEFQKALDCYNRALVNPSKFKDKILAKLLNKKGTALIKLKDFNNALECLKKSDNDYSYFAQGYCEYKLDLDVNDKFKSFLSIDKKFMLKQALILNELDFSAQSLAICDYLMKNHFRVDKFYYELLNAKRDALKNLDRDYADVVRIISKLYC